MFEKAKQKNEQLEQRALLILKVINCNLLLRSLSDTLRQDDFQLLLDK